LYRSSAAPSPRKLADRSLRLALAAIATAAATTAAAAAEQWPAQLPAGAYVLATQRSSLTASIRFLGFSRYTVSFRRLEGEVDYAPDRWRAARVAVRADPRSLANPRSVVGRTMLGLLEPERFPVISFSSQSMLVENGRTWLVGDLTLHGVTRPVRFAVTFHGPEEPATMDEAAFAFSGAGQIRRSDFGMTAMPALVHDQVELKFRTEFTPRSQTSPGERNSPAACGGPGARPPPCERAGVLP
jgi:polyisoprenoid-binding protein YceI